MKRAYGVNKLPINKKSCWLAALLLFTGLLMSCSEPGSNTENDNDPATDDCELGSATIGNCKL